MTRAITVIKVGGASARDAAQLIAARAASAAVCVVHGGGPQITALMLERHVEPRFCEGRRITDEATLECVEHGLRLVSLELCAALDDLGAHALGFPGGVVLAAQVPELGLVGSPVGADTTELEVVLARAGVPVVSPLGRAADGRLLNVNADDAAAEIALRLGATELSFLTDVEGVLDERGSLIESLSAAAPPAAASGGMLPKLAACARALAAGVETVHIGATQVTA